MLVLAISRCLLDSTITVAFSLSNPLRVQSLLGWSGKVADTRCGSDLAPAIMALDYGSLTVRLVLRGDPEPALTGGLHRTSGLEWYDETPLAWTTDRASVGVKKGPARTYNRVPRETKPLWR